MVRNGMVGEAGEPFVNLSNGLADKCGGKAPLRANVNLARAPHQMRPIYRFRPAAGHRYLYVFTDGAATKIGITGDVHDRLKRLSVASGRKLTIAAVWMFATDDALRIERRALERLDAHRLPGEWVRSNSTIVIALIEGLMHERPDTRPISDEEAVAIRWAVQQSLAARRGRPLPPPPAAQVRT